MIECLEFDDDAKYTAWNSSNCLKGKPTNSNVIEYTTSRNEVELKYIGKYWEYMKSVDTLLAAVRLKDQLKTEIKAFFISLSF